MFCIVRQFQGSDEALLGWRLLAATVCVFSWRSEALSQICRLCSAFSAHCRWGSEPVGKWFGGQGETKLISALGVRKLSLKKCHTDHLISLKPSHGVRLQVSSSL